MEATLQTKTFIFLTTRRSLAVWAVLSTTTSSEILLFIIVSILIQHSQRCQVQTIEVFEIGKTLLWLAFYWPFC